MQVSRPVRGLAAAAGLAAASALGTPAAAAAALATRQAGQHASAAQAAQYTPSPDEWWLSDWQVPQQVWPLTDGAGVTVGVVDSGVQASVPDLRGVVVPGGDMLGDPGAGETDFDTQSDGHGTAVAVLIAGQGYGTGTVGIAPGARILPVHAATPGVAGDAETLAAGIEFAVNHGAQVINVSLGLAAPSATSCDPVLQDAVAWALEHNVVVVAAAGDTDVTGPGPVEPASCAGVLAAGGVGPSGALWPYSTRQPYVSVAAPGQDVVYVGRDGMYTTAGAGTSASAPLVAGAAALIRSLYPSMPWYQVDQRLTDTAVPVGPVPNDGYGYGMIDPARAINVAGYPVSASAPDPQYAAFQAWLASPDGQAWAQVNSPRPATPSAAPTASPASSGARMIDMQAGTIARASAAPHAPKPAAPQRATLAGLVSTDMPTNPVMLVVALALCLAAVFVLTLVSALTRGRARHARHARVG